MPAEIRNVPPEKHPTASIRLGPRGPFPDIPLHRVLERRWLHYAFLSTDGELGLVANIARLGPPPDQPELGERTTSILLLHQKDRAWCASQFNAETLAPFWSAFALPHRHGTSGRFELSATSGNVGVALDLIRTGRPCTSQCTPFAVDQHLRWQSEPGIVARGSWNFQGRTYRDVEAIGYHERVRGYWGWPELGGWVFGFANDVARGKSGAPKRSVVFTLVQPPDPPDAPTASVMLWDRGRLVRHFPRRRVSVAVRGLLDRQHVQQAPNLASTLGVPAMEPIPQRLTITASMGRDRVAIDFFCDHAVRIVIPSETSLRPFSVHEVIGSVTVEGRLNGVAFEFETRGIVEFAGGAGGD